MGLVQRWDPLDSSHREGVVGDLVRLIRLEIELGLAETRRVLISTLVAVAVILPAAVAAIASLVVLLAAAMAPVFEAPWQHLVVSGGSVFIIAIAAVIWGLIRLRSIRWPRETVSSLEENWQWLGAQLKSRLKSR